jgi:hypothetical protein
MNDYEWRIKRLNEVYFISHRVYRNRKKSLKSFARILERVPPAYEVQVTNCSSLFCLNDRGNCVMRGIESDRTWKYGSALKMETVCSSEMLVSTYKFTRRYNPDQHQRMKSFCSLFSFVHRGGGGGTRTPGLDTINNARTTSKPHQIFPWFHEYVNYI